METARLEGTALNLTLRSGQVRWLMVGKGAPLKQALADFESEDYRLPLTVISTDMLNGSNTIKGLEWKQKRLEAGDLDGFQLITVCEEDALENARITAEAQSLNIISVYPGSGLSAPAVPENSDGDKKWKRLTSQLIIAFLLMVLGHIVISYLPLPGIAEIWHNTKPYFDTHFLFFVLAGFLAQMVDGVLSMGYGVTSATCLMAFGVSPVAMSAAIHTSEVFTTGISGYSHYRFGNVNKKLFKHLVIPGVIGAVIGALMLVFLNESSGKWLMPLIAVYAGFLGVKILIKAFKQPTRDVKAKRIGWLAWIGGFLDSFGGGGWGPIVTSTLIAKGRSPRYTVGSVSLTEFFVTLASAVTFFITVGVSHWNIVLGLLLGGGIAAPIAARLAGKLPRKTMMIAVGVMVLIWCVRMLIKSFA